MTVIALCSCGSKGSRTQGEVVTDLISHQFDSLAYNCEVVSVVLVDTLFGNMPANDSTYMAMEKEYTRLSNLRSKLIDDYVSGKRKRFELDELPSTDSILVQMRNYKRGYKGPLEAYVYKIIVKSDSYDLKKDVEGFLYLIDTTLTRVRAVPSDYIEQLERLRELEEFMLFM